jgi:hypothetical protein
MILGKARWKALPPLISRQSLLALHAHMFAKREHVAIPNGEKMPRFAGSRTWFVAASFACALLLNRSNWAAAQFITLGFLPGGTDYSFATAVSDGGTLTVVGL